MSNFFIWDLEKYKVNKENQYSNVTDDNVCFDFITREKAIEKLFNETEDANVKQVLRFAMELNNHYRKQSMTFYNAYHEIKKMLKKALDLTEKTIDKTYL